MAPSLIFALFALTVAADVLWVKPDDQAPATASAEAAERGEEEQAADQHCRHSGSRGNENKGTERTVTAALFSCRVYNFPCSTALGNYKEIIYREAN